ncbi:MAG TPA: DUF881 domain-containing protein [Anaerolineae bacterium]|nr:DUF881 domain-containing protein [Anaerolineae bacterium]
MRQLLGNKPLAMLIAALAIGMLISFQWPAALEGDAGAPDQVAQAIRLLELEQAELKAQVSRMRGTLTARQEEPAGSKGLLEDLQAELALQRAWAGLVAVRGPGIRVTLADSTRSWAGRADDLLVHDFDLRDVISLLWLAGAEAISVNGERVVQSTSLYCVGSTILVNDTRLSPPYVVLAIGDPDRLGEHLRNPGYLRDLKERADRLGVGLTFAPSASVTTPAYKGSVVQRYVQPGS